MNGIHKEKLKTALMVQGVFWAIPLLFMALLSIVPNPDVSRDLQTGLILSCFLMFLSPFLGWFIFLPAFQGFWHKTLAALLYTVAVWALSLGGLVAGMASGWESLPDHKAQVEKAREKPLFEEAVKKLQTRINALGSADETDRFIRAFAKDHLEKKPTPFPMEDMEYEELGLLLKFLDSKQQAFGPRAVAKMYFLLTQGADGAWSEAVDEAISESFYRHTEETLLAMGDAEKELEPQSEQWNKELVSWWKNDLVLPAYLDDEPVTQKVAEEKLVRQKLKAMRNTSNATLIDSLLAKKILSE